ncbi:DAO-domain-containing protein [Aspergillus steynii IBT 23096]|uniref:DAO-domain-containing protein n=1 Tax=Aspergillus steynii IBT 23096 TaxID=1392250 RepID=A0A2I2GR28_9EURO|nr:DAO-domain-containing protein [Aspergillus steynii IBT 23096]PLB55294.1 DAO-domain-containing protein [Aspergillus steynii IBT 23096]
MSTSPEGIYEPGIVDPGLPVPNPTQPFWLSEPSKISTLQSPWSEHADIVIIGSGITAASLTRTLYAHRPDLKIVIVEARDLCSGATGRNGGHVKVISPGVWFERERNYGRQEALRVMQFEHSHLDAIAACVKENDIQCDFRLLEGLDCYHDEATLGRAKRALDEMRKSVPELAARYTLYTSRKLLDERHCSDKCIGAIGMPAASVWPYKLVTALFERFVDENGLSVQTNTSVTSIEDEDDSNVATVRTTRGDIRARHVVHATNGWMSHLVHELQPFVSPVRANVQRQVPQGATLRVNSSFWLLYASTALSGFATRRKTMTT